MNNTSEIKRRLLSVKQTRQITGAMEMISVAKMRKALERVERNRAYFSMLENIVSDIASSGDEKVSALIKKPAGEKKLVIVIASDKGLCGAFNHDVFRAAEGEIDKNTIIMPIGRTAADAFSGVETDGEFVDCGMRPDAAVTRRMADKILGLFGDSVFEVKLVYTGLKTRASWEVRSKTLLPLSADGKSGGALFFEPSAADVLRSALPLYISGVLYYALLESTAAEHSARRAAMSASTKNADDMIEALSMEYNRSRQNTVTEQITEIIGSTRALGEGGAL